MKQRTFCPQCRSLDVKKEITASLVLGAPQNWICNNCGYANMVFPELKRLKTKKQK